MRKTLNNKWSFPKFIEKPILETLRFYPELINVDIEFCLRDKMKTSMATMPKISFLWRQKKKWKFYVFIKSKRNGHSPILIDSSFKAQVGCIAHELSHIVHYLSLTKIQIILFGIKYFLSSDFMLKVEKENDIFTIKKGLGKELYEFSFFVFSNASEEYMKYKKQNYFTPKQILDKTMVWEKSRAIKVKKKPKT